MRVIFQSIDDFFTKHVENFKRGLQVIGDAAEYLKDWLVDNSVFPDLIDRIGEEFDRLDSEMVAPFQEMTGEVKDGATEMLNSVGATFERLEPEMIAPVQLASGEVVDAFNGMKTESEAFLDSMLYIFEDEMSKMPEIVKLNTTKMEESYLSLAQKGVGALNQLFGSKTLGKIQNWIGQINGATSAAGGLLEVFSALTGIPIPASIAGILEDPIGGISDLLGGVGSDLVDSIGDAVGDVVGSIGGVFGFAKGGIIKQPSIIKAGATGQLGVVGEAGPEAILPLSRSASGELGVKSAGNSAPIINLTINGEIIEGSFIERVRREIEKTVDIYNQSPGRSL